MLSNLRLARPVLGNSLLVCLWVLRAQLVPIHGLCAGEKLLARLLSYRERLPHLLRLLRAAGFRELLGPLHRFVRLVPCGPLGSLLRNLGGGLTLPLGFIGLAVRVPGALVPKRLGYLGGFGLIGKAVERVDVGRVGVSFCSLGHECFTIEIICRSSAARGRGRLPSIHSARRELRYGLRRRRPG